MFIEISITNIFIVIRVTINWEERTIQPLCCSSKLVSTSLKQTQVHLPLEEENRINNKHRSLRLSYMRTSKTQLLLHILIFLQ